MQRHSWIFATIKLNWANMITNKGAFWSLMLLMAVQNLIYLGLWGAIFSQISSLRGWGLREISFLYGAGAIGYGIFFCLFGGLNQLGETIENGTLDVYLARPKSPLLSALMHRMRADSLGDIVAGIVMIAFLVRPTLADLPLMLALTFFSGIVYMSVRLLLHCCAFWGMNSSACENSYMAFIIASTNPMNGFGPWGKMVLLTLFPAGYIALLPVEILRDFSWRLMGMEILAALFFLALSLFLFDRGLKRYASGNKFIVLR